MSAQTRARRVFGAGRCYSAGVDGTSAVSTSPQAVHSKLCSSGWPATPGVTRTNCIGVAQAGQAGAGGGAESDMRQLNGGTSLPAIQYFPVVDV